MGPSLRWGGGEERGNNQLALSQNVVTSYAHSREKNPVLHTLNLPNNPVLT
jgi:hypothetical protein